MSRATDAYEALTLAMERTAPACTGFEEFTSDDLDNHTREALAAICDGCPLITLCRDYAQAAKPLPGIWGGRTWTRGTYKKGDE